MGASVRLNAFELAERIGAGGMGAVYRAEHTETGQQVAIKVLLAEVARRDDKRRNFRREVQALAKLHHPAVASVLDYGAIDTRTAERGPDAFVEGAPWFAMEYVDGRPMPKRSRSWQWETLETVLLTTLDGLAHAHARSTVHRDLKPENILLETAKGEDEPGAKLVDFGIARIFDPDIEDPTEPSRRITGTPKYMAPEQIRGEWRDQGPWTDLYALGCVIWRIVCDAPLFDGETTEDILEGHLQEQPSNFNPRMPVPEGLEHWLRGLVHRDIDRRTGCAADAARQLLRLGEPLSSGPATTAPSPESAVAATAGQPTLQSMVTMVGSTLDSEVEPTNAELPTPDDRDAAVPVGDTSEVAEDSVTPMDLESDRPPISPNWRRGHSERKAAVVPRAGLELFALRDVPIVDRTPERDRLWEALRRVDRDGVPELVTLEAAAGCSLTTAVAPNYSKKCTRIASIRPPPAGRTIGAAPANTNEPSNRCCRRRNDSRNGSNSKNANRSSNAAGS